MKYVVLYMEDGSLKFDTFDAVEVAIDFIHDQGGIILKTVELQEK